MTIEEKVNGIVDCCIRDISHLNIHYLTEMFSVYVLYNRQSNRQSNFYIKRKGVDVIGIKIDGPFEMWHNFCHEAGHLFLHSTNQTDMPCSFNMMQEAQAAKFALLLMMPEKLIRKHGLFEVQDIANYFNVPFDIALQRIEMLIDKTRITTYSR